MANVEYILRTNRYGMRERNCGGWLMISKFSGWEMRWSLEDAREEESGRGEGV